MMPEARGETGNKVPENSRNHDNGWKERGTSHPATENMNLYPMSEVRGRAARADFKLVT